MLFAERGIFCRFTGVRLQRPRTFRRLVKLGAWVVFHRGQGPGREGPQSSRPGSCNLSFEDCCGIVGVIQGFGFRKICDDFFVISQKGVPAVGM